MKNFYPHISAISEMTDKNRGTLFFDAQCPSCSALAARFAPSLRRHGFDIAPLQSRAASDLLRIDPTDLLTEMRLLTAGGTTLGGADVLLHLGRFIWWATPFRLIAHLPGGLSFLRRYYRRIAASRNCAAGSCPALPPRPACPAWLPLLFLPILAALLTYKLQPWLFMWVLAVAIFFGCKWLTYRDAAAALHRPPLARTLAYLFLWPGMDAQPFLAPRDKSPLPHLRQWLFAAIKTLAGAALLWLIARRASSPLLAGWLGMLGLIFILHFGAFHLLALAWRAAGIRVQPIMQNPAAARSLGEFWSLRWNRGFNDIARHHIFSPLRPILGVAPATLIAFLASGLVHDLVISVPARAGYGLPTLYFLLQGIGVLAERSGFGKKIGLRRGLRGRLFTIAVVAGPAFWLFHPPFVTRVFVPFMEVIKAI